MELDLDTARPSYGLELEDELEKPTVQTGWMPTGLGACQVHILDASGTHRFDANTVRAAVAGDLLRLGNPLGPSDLSRQPGYLYRTRELQILLTKGEIHRLVLRQLHPVEVLKLRRRYGNFFEIDEDFYEKTTGVAL